MSPSVIHLRASSIDDYLDCSRRMFASSYRDLVKQAGYEIRDQVQYVTGNIGSGIHAAADFYNMYFIKNKIQPNESAILSGIEIGFAEFKRRTLQDMETKEVRNTLQFPDNEAIKAHIAEYARVYVKVILPKYNIEVSEQKFDVPIMPGFAYKSTLDSFGDFTLHDLKTGKIKTPAMAQIGTYVYLLRQSGFTVKKAQLDYLIKPKGKASDPPEHVIIEYDPDECLKLSQHGTVSIINDMKEFMRTGSLDRVLPNPRSEKCTFFMCPLFNTKSCAGWKAKG